MGMGTRPEAAALAKDDGWAREVAGGCSECLDLSSGSEGGIYRFVELVCCEE